MCGSLYELRLIADLRSFRLRTSTLRTFALVVLQPHMTLGELITKVHLFRPQALSSFGKSYRTRIPLLNCLSPLERYATQ